MPSTARTFPYEAVIFDMDGVIVDTEAFYQKEERAFADYLGVEVSDAEILDMVGKSHQHFVRTVTRWLTLAGQEGLTGAEAEARYRAWSADRPRDYRSMMFPGIHEALDGLHRRGTRVALASSSPRASILAVLDQLGIADAFELVVSGAELRESKPNPAIYLLTLEQLGLPAAACCCIEDSVPGITAGRRAGLTVFARREERFGFFQAEADAILDRVDDILKVTERV